MTLSVYNIERLTWKAKHVPLSVSVCSNIPGYNDPKCFGTNGDSHQLLNNMIEYLLKVSEKSYESLMSDFEVVFEEIDEKIAEHEFEDDELDYMAEM